MKRQIIKIDDDKCNGCGNCIPGCPEGALQMIDGKARLVSDLFCDGLGACIGTCPRDAITVEEREAEAYDERYVMENNIIKAGSNTIKAHLLHLKEHGETGFLKIAIDVLKEKGLDVPELEEHKSPEVPVQPVHQEGGGHGGGCPGAAMMDRRMFETPSNGKTAVNVDSQLRQWPIQLTLLNPHAPYFRNADLLVAADCVPFAYSNFHERFLKGKIMMTFCPKLDRNIDQYIEKLTAIFRHNDIKSVSVVHMEVPCCSGTVLILQKAMQQAGKVIPIKDYTISIDGKII